MSLQEQQPLPVNGDDFEDGELVDAPPPPKKGPVEENAAKSSVMPETMASANRFASSVKEVASDLGEATAAVVTHELRSRTNAPTTSASSTTAHSDAIKANAAKGKAVGAAVGSSATHAILGIAKRLGAHVCDGCRTKNLYNYYRCETCESSGRQTQEQQRLGLDGGFDLCTACYEKQQSGSKVHDAGHSFFLHNNAQYSIRVLGAIVLALIVLRFLCSRVLGF